MRNNKITKSLFYIFILIILLYAIYTARNIILGPEIYIDSNIGITNSQLYELKGHTKNTQKLYVNNLKMFLLSDKSFSEKVLLQPGKNIFIIKAKDRFGQSISKTLTMIYNKNN